MSQMRHWFVLRFSWCFFLYFWLTAITNTNYFNHMVVLASSSSSSSKYNSCVITPELSASNSPTSFIHNLTPIKEVTISSSSSNHSRAGLFSVEFSNLRLSGSPVTWTVVESNNDVNPIDGSNQIGEIKIIQGPSFYVGMEWQKLNFIPGIIHVHVEDGDSEEKNNNNNNNNNNNVWSFTSGQIIEASLLFGGGDYRCPDDQLNSCIFFGISCQSRIKSIEFHSNSGYDRQFTNLWLGGGPPVISTTTTTTITTTTTTTTTTTFHHLCDAYIEEKGAISPDSVPFDGLTKRLVDIPFFNSEEDIRTSGFKIINGFIPFLNYTDSSVIFQRHNTLTRSIISVNRSRYFGFRWEWQESPLHSMVLFKVRDVSWEISGRFLMEINTDSTSDYNGRFVGLLCSFPVEQVELITPLGSVESLRHVTLGFEKGVFPDHPGNPQLPPSTTTTTTINPPTTPLIPESSDNTPIGIIAGATAGAVGLVSLGGVGYYLYSTARPELNAEEMDFSSDWVEAQQIAETSAIEDASFP